MLRTNKTLIILTYFVRAYTNNKFLRSITNVPGPMMHNVYNENGSQCLWVALQVSTVLRARSKTFGFIVYITEVFAS